MTETARGPLGLSGTRRLRTALWGCLLTNLLKRANKEDMTLTRPVIAHCVEQGRVCLSEGAWFHRLGFSLKLPDEPDESLGC